MKVFRSAFIALTEVEQQRNKKTALLGVSFVQLSNAGSKLVTAPSQMIENSF